MAEKKKRRVRSFFHE
jgi:hypothetical protein